MAALFGMKTDLWKRTRSSRVIASSISSVGEMREYGWAPNITWANRSLARKVGCARCWISSCLVLTRARSISFCGNEARKTTSAMRSRTSSAKIEMVEAATVVKSAPEPTLRVAPRRSISSASCRLVRVAVPSVSKLESISLSPGNSEGSLASPERIARRKLINGRRLSSTMTSLKPFASVASIGSGILSGRGASGAGICRRKISDSVINRFIPRSHFAHGAVCSYQRRWTKEFGGGSGCYFGRDLSGVKLVSSDFLQRHGRMGLNWFIGCLRYLWQRRRWLFRLTRNLRRRRCCLLGRRHDIEQYAIIGVQVTRQHVFDLIGRDFEIFTKIGIEQLRIAVIKREFGQLFGSIERCLTAAQSSVEKIVAQLRHLFGAGTHSCQFLHFA